MPVITYTSCTDCGIPLAVKSGIPDRFTKHCYKCGQLCGYTTTYSKNPKLYTGKEMNYKND